MPSSNRSDFRVRPRAARPGHGEAEPRSQTQKSSATPSDGLPARDVAVSALFSVLVEKHPFDDVFAKAAAARGLASRDRAFARALATAVLRNRGSLQAVLSTYLEKPLPEHQGRLHQILLAGAAQLLLLKTPPHAAISLAVDQCRADRLARKFAKLTNAVLRRVSESGGGRLASLDNAALTFPDWLLARWSKCYGAIEARKIAQASLFEPALDLTIKADPEVWAARLNGLALPTGSVRLASAGRVEDLDGYTEGHWWVQDAAAALPVKFIGDIRNRTVLDLCAAPGGKTAQLAAAGAHVTAVDKSRGRLARLKDNLQRLALDAETVVADALTFDPGKTFDFVLLDAPCTSTGTIRRHPDILTLKRIEDVAALASLQAALLARAARLVGPGGTLAYCTCSLEPEEGEDQIAAFLKQNPEFSRKPPSSNGVAIPVEWRRDTGDLRTLPTHLSELPQGLQGIDGFYAAVLTRAR